MKECSNKEGANPADSECSTKKDLFVIVVLFFLAHGLLPLNSGVYFDDWPLFYLKNDAVNELLSSVGYQFRSLIFMFLHNFPMLSRLAMFISFLAATIFFYKTISSIKEIARGERFFLASFLCLFPVFLGKISYLHVPYFLCLFFFVFATYLLNIFLIRRSMLCYVFALFSFSLSFNIESLLVFYVAPLMLIAYRENFLGNWRKSLSKIKKYVPFIILPAVFWAIKTIYFKPYGVYVNVNSISLRDLLTAPYAALVAVGNNFLLPLSFLWGVPAYWSFMPFMFLTMIFLYPYFKKNLDTNSQDKRLFFLGCILYFIALLPYFAVSRTGIFYGLGWYGRDQLLVPFGAGMIFLFGSSLVIREFKLHSNIRAFLLSFIIALSLTTQIACYVQFQLSWFKKIAIAEAFKDNPLIRHNTTFLVDDKTIEDDLGFEVRFHDYTGLMKYAFGDERRFAMKKSEIPHLIAYSYPFADEKRAVLCANSDSPTIDCIASLSRALVRRPEFYMAEYIPKKPIYLITIRKGWVSQYAPLDYLLKRTISRFINQKKFMYYKGIMVTVDCVPLPESS